MLPDESIVRLKLSQLRLERPRQWGGCWLALELWHELELDEFWAARLSPSRKGTRWDQILQILVVYRLLSPGSEWRLHREWYGRSALSDLLGTMDSVDDIETMIAAGLFLGKLSQRLDGPKLQAVYESQRWPNSASLQASRGSSAQSMLSSQDVDQLARALEHAMHEPPSNVTDPAASGRTDIAFDSAADDDADQQRRQLAWELLNDQDGGSVEYRYSVLPLIIADQLFELDLVYFRDRQSPAEPAARSKRMVMTLNAPALGRVEVLAQAIGERVAITIKADSAASRQVLSGEQERVRELLVRLGWGVDAVRYEVDGIDLRAAAHVVEHVLNGDSLSRWI